MTLQKSAASKPAPEESRERDLEAENARLTGALRESELRFSAFMDNIPERCFLLDADFTYRYLNRAAVSSKPYDRLARIGSKIPPAKGGDPAGVLESYREVLRSGNPFSKVVALRGADGSERLFSVRAFKIEELLALIWSDITERNENAERLKAAEKELRSLTQHILDVREEERKSVARELHDELGQTLTAIELELRVIARREHEAGGDRAGRIDELLFMVNQSIRAVQRLSSELRPAVLDRLGIKAAIQWLAEGAASRCFLEPRLDIEIREETIGPKTAIALFRITQESLTNVVRYAMASTFSIRMLEEGQAVRLSIHDDGIGITESQVNAPGSFGLQGIRERARGLGGCARIRGEAGRGTDVEVSIPIPAGGILP